MSCLIQVCCCTSYSTSCPRWLHHLERLLPPGLGQRLVPHRLEHLGRSQAGQESLCHAKVQLVLLGRPLLVHLARSGLLLGQLLRPDRSVGLLLQGVTAKEVEQQAAASLPHFPSWRSLALGEEGEALDLEVVARVQEVMEDQGRREAQRPQEAFWRLFPRKVLQQLSYTCYPCPTPRCPPASPRCRSAWTVLPPPALGCWSASLWRTGPIHCNRISGSKTTSSRCSNFIML